MARIEFDGADLMDDLKNIMDLPDEVLQNMLDAEADVVVEAQKDEIEKLGLEDTGQLKESIARTQKMKVSNTGYGKYIEIYPQGTRKDGVRNAEVGFIHEFGAPHKGIAAKNWMNNANDKSADEAIAAAESVYDNFLKKNNL